MNRTSAAAVVRKWTQECRNACAKPVVSTRVYPVRRVTGLPVRLDVWEEGPEVVRRSGEFYLAHYQLDDYRTVDGVAVPFYVRRERPHSTMTFRFTEVRQNVAYQIRSSEPRLGRLISSGLISR